MYVRGKGELMVSKCKALRAAAKPLRAPMNSLISLGTRDQAGKLLLFL